MRTAAPPKPDDVIAIACADLHLCHQAPACRAAEPCWYEAMLRPIQQLQNLANCYNAPILCAGDVFDRWNAPPAVINWAIRVLPKMYAVPGQHDMPQHSYDELARSAYDTLQLAGVIINLPPGQPTVIKHAKNKPFTAVGYPYGHSAGQTTRLPSALPHPIVAVCHEYIWTGEHKYPGAETARNVRRKAKSLSHFDCAIFGDNHMGFMTKVKRCHVFNCGTFTRRRTSDADYHPQVGLIMQDGQIVPTPLDISQDVIDRAITDATPAQENLNVDRFLEELDGLALNPLDFRSLVSHYLSTNKPRPEVEQAIIEAIQ